MGRLKDGLADHNKAVSLTQLSPDPLVARGHFLLDWQKEPVRALEDFDKAVSLAPDMAEAYLGRGEARLEIGQPARALPDLNRAIELVPDLLYARTARAQAYEDMGDVQRSEDEYRKVLDMTPTFTPALLGLGYIQLDRKDREGALQNFDAAFLHASSPDLVRESRRALSYFLVTGEVKQYRDFPVSLSYDILKDPVLMAEDLQANSLLDLEIADYAEIPVSLVLTPSS